MNRTLPYPYRNIAAALMLLLTSTAHAESDDEIDSYEILGKFPTSQLAKRVKPFQTRWNFFYGDLTLASERSSTETAITNRVSKFNFEGFQIGGRIEFDYWFQSGRYNRRTWGWINDLQIFYAGPVDGGTGAPLTYAGGSSLLGFRPFGSGLNYSMTPEFSLLLGPAVEQFPSIQVSDDQLSYEIYRPLLVSIKAGGRLRLPIVPMMRQFSIEIGSYYQFPLLPLGNASGAVLSTGSTQSYALQGLVDFRISSSITLGAGAYATWFNLKYQSPELFVPDSVKLRMISYVGSIRINL